MRRFALVAALGSWWLGLWGKGNYVTNFERGVYDREKPFVAPNDGLAIYSVGEGFVGALRAFFAAS